MTKRTKPPAGETPESEAAKESFLRSRGAALTRTALAAGMHPVAIYNRRKAAAQRQNERSNTA